MNFKTIKTDLNVINMKKYFGSMSKKDLNGNVVINRYSMRLYLLNTFNPKSTEYILQSLFGN